MQRRDFLKTSALAMGATLLESCAKEEPQFLYQTIRHKSYLPGESVWRSSICGECPAGCGVQVRTVDENIKKIEGLTSYPVNRGGVCALGQSTPQKTYNPDRLQHPLKRQGPRGEFVEISWEEALGEAAGALAEARQKKPQRIAVVGNDSTGLLAALTRRLASSVGAPPAVFVEPFELEVERRAAKIVFGVTETPFFDVEHSDYLVSIGAPILDAWRNPVFYGRSVADMRRARTGRRGKFVQVEPRMSPTAATADDWLPVRPGSEGVFAVALGHKLIQQGRVPSDAAQTFERLVGGSLRNIISVKETCGIEEARITRLANELAQAEFPVIIAGGSSAAHAHGLFNVVAGLLLNTLLGSVGRAGGVYAGRSFNFEKKVEPANNAQGSLGTLAEKILNGHIDVLFASECDPLHVIPNGVKTIQSTDNVFVISCNSFLNDTSKLADLVLPTHTELERLNVVCPSPSMGVPVLGMSRRVIQPMYATRHPGDIILATAKALGDDVAPEFKWSSFTNLVETVFNEQMPTLPGGDSVDADFWTLFEDALAQGGLWQEGPLQPPPAWQPKVSQKLQPPVATQLQTDFPFHLLPFETIKGWDGRAANRPWMQELPDPNSTVMWDSWIEISKQDADPLGIRTGDLVRVTSSQGALETHAVLNPAVRPGVVGIPLGGGHLDHGRYARGRGANPMNLVEPQTLVKGTGALAWAATQVRIQRVRSGKLALYGAGLRQPENIPRGRVR